MTVWELRAVCRSWLDGLEAHWRRLGKGPVVCPTRAPGWRLEKVLSFQGGSPEGVLRDLQSMSSFPGRGNHDPERSNSLVGTDVGEGTFY